MKNTKRLVLSFIWFTALYPTLSGCAWQRGRADQKTVRQVIYDIWKPKSEWSTYLDFHRYVEANKKFLHFPEGRLCYVEKGTGEDVILLHGLVGSKNVWRANFLPLAEHFHVVAIDAFGSGDSDNPHHTKYRYNPENLAATVLRVMDMLKIEKAHLVGSSLGGLMALLIARDQPERVRSLVLFAPAVWDYYGKLVKAAGLAFGIGPLIATARPTAEFAGSLLDATVYNREVLTDADRILETEALMQEGALNALIEKSRALFDEKYIQTVSQSFRGLKTRTLILWGENDAVLPPYCAHQLYEVLPNSRLIWIPACGHHPQEEVPRLVNDEMLWFLTNGKVGTHGGQHLP